MPENKRRLECSGCGPTTHVYVARVPEKGHTYECMACGNRQLVDE